MTIRYTGGAIVGLTVTISDGGGVLYSNSALLMGSTPVTVVSSAGSGQLFVGNNVNVSGTLLFNEDLATDCSDPVEPGTEYQYFEVVSSTDIISGTVCCELEDMPSDAPVISGCPANQTIDIISDCSAIASWSPPTATTTCGESATITLTSGYDSGQPFPLGETTVVYTATDAYGNTATCSFIIEVRDVTNPVIDCPGNFTELVNTSCNFTLDDYSFLINASDNCDSDVEITQSPTPGTLVSGANTVVPVTFTATDDAGNFNTCTFDVTLIDVIPPQFTCPTSHDELLDAGCEFTVPDYRPAIATDNCDTSVPIVQTPAPGTVLTGLNSVHPIKITATDDSNNQKVCDFNITLRDVTPPEFTSFPSDETLYTGIGSTNCSVVATWATPTADDNCSITVTQTEGASSGTPFTVGGPYTITYEVRDASDNVITNSFTITVIDDTAPEFTSFPSDQTLYTVAGSADCSAMATWTVPTADDNCSVTVTQIAGDPSGSTFAVGGPYTITYEARDGSDNVITNSFTITVVDDTDPEFTSFPSDQTLYTGVGSTSCTVNASWVTPVASDNCSVTVTQTAGAASGTAFAVGGPHTITYEAKDPSDNVITRSFTITVIDDTDPEFTSFPSDQTLYTGAGNTTCTVDASWVIPSASDNCSVTVTQTAGAASGTAFAVGGPHTITYEAKDPSDNVITRSFTITVVDDTDPEFTSFPSDQTLYTGAGNTTCTVDASWVIPSASDNCSVTVTQTAGAASGTAFAVGGPHTITYEARDASDNVITRSFAITVVDDTDPEFTSFPSDQTLYTGVGSTSCAVNANWGTPVANDNCSVTVTQTAGEASGTAFAVGGPYTITYEARDGSDNVITNSFTITVVDDTDPEFTSFPSDQTLYTGVGSTSCTVNVNWVTPVASDNCSVTVTQTAGAASGTAFAVGGPYTITYEARDASDNVITRSFAITVVDDTDPEFTSFPSDQTLYTEAGNTTCTMNANWTEPTASDNCDATPDLTSNFPSGYAFALGTTEVIYTAKDASNNTAIQSFFVTVVDDTDPVIVDLPSDITINAPSNSCQTIVSWTEPEASDNCDTDVALTSMPANGTSFPVGETTVTYTATDNVGNNVVDAFKVTVKDVTAPAFSGCPANITRTAGPGACTATASWNAPSATDACGVTVTNTHAPGATFPVGITTVTYTAKDPSGNETICSFTVTVRDGTAPIISDCNHGATLEVTADDSCDAIATWTEPAATDNCSVTMTRTHAPGAVFPLGKTDVVYTFTDPSGNTSTCAFKVMVKDRTAPVISGCASSDIVVSLSSGCEASATWTAPTFIDNCSATMSGSHTPGQMFPIGTTVVTYTATDPAGNLATCSFNVIVEDHISPIFDNCISADIVVSSGTDCGAVVNWTALTATDNCGETLVEMTHAAGSFFEVGTTEVTYTATDAVGNVTTCVFNVVVNDDTPPVITNCPADIQAAANESCKAFVTWDAPTAIDNCSTVTLASNFDPSHAFEIGTTEVKYTATDAEGNISYCTFNVIVTDGTPPVVACSADITVNADANCKATVVWELPQASDNCSAVTLTSSHNPGDVFPIGETEVTYTATDADGNDALCMFTITVIDTATPVITGCPSDVTVSVTGSACEVAASWTPPTAGDNCAAVTITSSHEPGDLFAIGTTAVTYTATDAAGNTSTCSFNVVVADEAIPVFTTHPGDITISTEDECSANVNWTAPSVSDCGVITLTSTHAPGSAFPIGSTEVIYTASDESGNTSTTKFNVIVEDKTAPVFMTCPEGVLAAADPSCTAPVSWTPPDAADNCEMASITSTHTPDDVFEKGTTEVIYTATDIYGNVSVCKFHVTVGNEHPPAISGCPGDIELKADASGQVAAEWTLPTATVVCGEVSMASSHSPGEMFHIGTTQVTYTATDSDGNASTCSFNVVVAYDEVQFDVVPIVTPDGDGINDQWTLGNIEKFLENRVVIVDRWGSVIFSVTGYDNQNVVWKGESSSGGVVPTGTYFYTIGVRIGPDYREKKGFVELIR